MHRIHAWWRHSRHDARAAAVRARFDGLPAHLQREVLDVFGDELARGWVPRTSDVEGAINTVEARHRAR